MFSEASIIDIVTGIKVVQFPFLPRLRGVTGWAAACCLVWINFEQSALAQPVIGGKQEVAEADLLNNGEEEPLVDDSLSPFRFDALDERAPYDPEVVRSLREIEEFTAREQWPEVVESLQALIDRSETLLMPTPEGRWVPLRDQITLRIGLLPANGMRVYHQYFDAEAQRLWDQARPSDDLGQCGELARRFPYTPAGQAAASYIGSRLFDEGDFGGAAMWYRRLWLMQADLTRHLAWRHRAAYAFLQVGDITLARSLFGPTDLAPSAEPGALLTTAIDWVNQAQPISPQTPRLTDWPLWHGNDAHQGAVTEGFPTLLPQWSIASTSRHLLLTELDRLSFELSRHQRAAFPAWPVVAVDGLAAVRTFRGIQVVNVADGTLLWETDEPASPERVLTGDLQTASRDQVEMRVVQGLAQVQPGQADQSPLAAFLYQDLISGILAADRRQLLALEDNSGQLQQPNPYANFGWASSEDLFGRDWESNRVVSFDLATGRRRWSIGGTRQHAEFDPPLAGTYFLGVPVPSDGELYVLGERQRQIDLLALHPDTGEPVWSCELLTTGTSISQDLVRRLWACQPAVCGSMIVCPTGLGWVFGIDRWQHQVIWAHRYAPRADQSSRNVYRRAVQSMQPMGTRWTLAPPMLDGHRVLLSPVEVPDEFGVNYHPTLVCLDAYTGSVIWERPKEELTQLAAVVDGLAIVVGNQAISALRTTTGETVWRTEFQESGIPAGRGLVAGDRFLLPLGGGQLWSFDLRSGEIVDRQVSLTPGIQIGNITLHRGMLLSSGPQGLTGYPLEATWRDWIDERLAADPQSVEALLKEAEIAIVSGDYERALSLLPTVESQPLATEISEGDPASSRVRTLRRQLLLQLVESDLTSRDEEFAELKALTFEEEDRIEVFKVEADRAMARGAWGEAFEVYQSLLALTGDRMVDDGPVQIRIDRLVSSRLQELWLAALPEVQSSLDEHIEQAVLLADADGEMERSRAVRLFGFHPAAIPLLIRQADDASDAGRLVEGEILWRRLQATSDPSVAAYATWRSLEMLCQRGLYDDVRRQAATIPQSLSGVLVAGRDLSARVEELLSRTPSRAGDTPWTLPADPAWQFERLGWQGYQQKQFLWIEGDLPPSMESFEITFQQQTPRRINLVDSATGLRWGTPIPGGHGRQNYMSYWPGLLVDGHALYLSFQDTITCLSPFESSVVWSSTLNSNNLTLQSQRYARGLAPAPLVPPNQLTQATGARGVQSTAGLLADANEYGVLLYGDQELILLDPLNGEVQWKLPGISWETTARLIGDVVYLIDSTPENSFAVRAQDARLLSTLPYLPQDPRQRAAFERRIPEAGENAGGRAQNQRGTTAPPTRRTPPILPRPASSLRASERADNPEMNPETPDQETAPQRVISHWGDGMFAIFKNRFVRIDHDDEVLWLSAIHPATGHVEWMLEFPARVRMALFSRRWVFLLSEETGTTWLVNLEDGQCTLMEPVAEELRAGHTSYIVADRDYVFLAVNHLENPVATYVGVPSVQVHGTLLCWSRRSGELLWSQLFENLHLVLQHLDRIPVLVFTGVQHVQKQVINYQEARVRLVDKQTGGIGLEEQWASIGGSINQFVVDPSRQVLELRSYQDRVRMSSTPAIPDQPPSPPE